MRHLRARLMLLTMVLAAVAGAAWWRGRMLDEGTNAMADIPTSTGELADGTPIQLPLTDEKWKTLLTPEQFYVCRKHGTERSFSGEYWNTKSPGVYKCVCCGNELFESKTKFDSGTGWPSYYAPLGEGHVGTSEDRGWFTTRTEVHCNKCGAHLGHVFDDGPPPTGLRYCINSVALRFVEKAE